MKVLFNFALLACCLFFPQLASAHRHPPPHEDAANPASPSFLLDVVDPSHLRSLKNKDKDKNKARCGTKDLSRQERKNLQSKFLKWKKIKDKTNNGNGNGNGSNRNLQTETIVVPTYFHVTTNRRGTKGVVPPQFIGDQIDVLNAAFDFTDPATGDGVRFFFDLVSTDVTAKGQYYNVRDERAMKQELRLGGRDALNVYTGSGGGSLGFAYFPNILDDPNDAILDGVVIDYRTLPGFNYAPYDEGGKYEMA